jgi:GNAT superfamily N-acetyltransferase
MKLAQEAIARTVEREEKIQVPITCRDNFLFEHKGFNYYVIDLKHSDFSILDEITAACEAVESDTWKAQEDFFEYIRKSDILVYAERDGRIVGFNLVSLMLINEYCFYTIDEAMVLRAFQGNNIARNIVTATLWWFLKIVNLDKAVKKCVLVSISSNPKVVNMYFKNKYITRTLDNSFYPSENLIAVHRAYLAKNNFELVNPEYPFCVKNLFPGSQQLDWSNKKNQFVDEVKKRMPKEFDHARRGDAWAFMVVPSKRMSYFAIRATVLAFFGTKALFHKKIGLLRNKKNLETRPDLTRIRLIDGKFFDVQPNERRKGDRRLHDAGCDASGINRRVADRRIGMQAEFAR